MEQVVAKPIQKLLNLNKSDYYKVHLSLVNAILPDSAKMTPRELEVLATFMSFEGDIVEDDRFGTTARRKVMELLDLSHGGLGNFMKGLITKGFLYKVNDKLVVREFLNNNRKQQLYNFKLVNTDGY